MCGLPEEVSDGRRFYLNPIYSTKPLFAQSAGMKLLAAKGKVDIQAQGDALSALAKNDIDITSVEGTITVTATKELILTCGGGYIKLSDGNIEIADPQNILFKSANWQKMGPADFDIDIPELPRGCNEYFIAHDEDTGEIRPNQRYRITTGTGEVYEGVTDAEGKTASIFTAAAENMKIEFL